MSRLVTLAELFRAASVEADPAEVAKTMLAANFPVTRNPGAHWAVRKEDAVSQREAVRLARTVTADG